MSSRGFSTLVLLCAAGVCAQVLPHMAQLEGWAYVDIIAATSDVVVCTKRVSGAQGELFALDTLAKRVSWRKNGYALTRGETDGRGNFLLIDSPDKLLSRKLTNGDVNWQKTFPHPALNGRQGSDPNAPRRIRHRYRGPFVRGRKAFIFRQTLEDTPSANALSHDWLVFDTADGRLLHHGDGCALALAGDVLLIRTYDASIAAVSGFDFKERQVYSRQMNAQLDARPMDAGSTERALQYSHEGKCIFYLNAAADHAALYDSSAAKLTSIQSPRKPHWRTDWLLLSNCAVRYSLDIVDDRESLPAWVEVYDLNGRLIREHTFECSPDVGREPLRFAGTSGNGAVVFRQDERLLVFDMPAVELTTRLQRKPDAPWGNIFTKRGSDIIYAVAPGPPSKMTNADQPAYTLAVQLISLKTGEAIWKHNEQLSSTKP